MALKWPDKDPQAEKDYAIDWSAMLQDGETITASLWTPDSGIVTADESINGGVCTVWLSGGTAGTTYNIVNRITTSRGLIDERTIQVKVKEL